MAIDIDKIEKLIRLANNNPNDNEANLAARKACKMLADYKFNGQPTVTIPKSPSQSSTYKKEPWAGFWDEVKRAKQETHRSNYYGEYRRTPPPHETTKKCKNCGQTFSSWIMDICQPCAKKASDAGPTNNPGDMKDKWTDPRTGTVPPRSDEGYTARKRCRVCNSIYEGNECPTCREIYKTFTGRYSSRTPEKKVRQCVKCGHHKETMRVTSIFTCNECEWKEWQEKQDETGKNS